MNVREIFTTLRGLTRAELLGCLEDLIRTTPDITDAVRLMYMHKSVRDPEFLPRDDADETAVMAFRLSILQLVTVSERCETLAALEAAAPFKLATYERTAAERIVAYHRAIRGRLPAPAPRTLQ